MHPSGSSLPSNSSGIKVIIIGCGIAGLGCAIACTQKGHKVVVFQKSECNSDLKSLADDISLPSFLSRPHVEFRLQLVTPTPKVGRPFEGWDPGEKIHSLRRIPNLLHLGVQPLPDHEHDSYVYITQMHELLLAHALSIGVEMRTGLNVIAYRQNEIVRKAGIALDNGERIEGDVVVCVGAGNFEREDIPGEANAAEKKFSPSENNPSFDTRDHGDDISRSRPFNKEDVAYPWTGSDVHFDTSGQSGKAFTHGEEANRLSTTFEAGRSTSVNVSSSSSKAQSTSTVDWTYRDPLRTWADGRLLIIGSPLVSTDAHDTSQAIEDGVVLAVTLHLAGKHNVPLAVKAWERIRYVHSSPFFPSFFFLDPSAPIWSSFPSLSGVCQSI
ncbi:hypothetical protein K443DRAFT_677995 [Laccaria amethystina LaAM-08-1]|uniref:FAD-dependent oxidoreductase 2 FAD-binding domain-containing protein n=1 Tax=Laccaria amethystina LaAM-08-1 TaxID=1095629 RepID=A0A0C9WSZ6_9AGAR|nr:hypothetical protein K443DRAFT_677995 [Laccaria amethystina LaAM-08-1]